jgi:hypothetical protein
LERYTSRLTVYLSTVDPVSSPISSLSSENEIENDPEASQDFYSEDGIPQPPLDDFDENEVEVEAQDDMEDVEEVGEEEEEEEEEEEDIPMRPEPMAPAKKDSSKMTARQRAKEFGEGIWGEELRELPMGWFFCFL